MSIMAPRRPPFPSAWEQSLEDQLIDARCTIAELRAQVRAFEHANAAWGPEGTITELEKRIGELEAEHSEELSAITEQHIADCRELWAKIDAAEQALTAERQRREECEAALRRYTGTDLPNSGPASDYFSTTEAENE